MALKLSLAPKTAQFNDGMWLQENLPVNRYEDMMARLDRLPSRLMAL
jgi:hypothetical protein